MIYSQKLKSAVRFAIKTHEVYQKQTRKGKEIAYITHPLTVGMILAKVGAHEDVIAAGILHDTIEDSTLEKKVTKEMLLERFGENVSDLVLSVTEKDRTLSWEDRKSDALQKIESFSHDSLLVKSADILSNMSELMDDYGRYGEDVFLRFSASKEKMMAHQVASIEMIINCWQNNPLSEDLQNLLESLKKLQN